MICFLLYMKEKWTNASALKSLGQNRIFYLCELSKKLLKINSLWYLSCTLFSVHMQLFCIIKYLQKSKKMIQLTTEQRTFIVKTFHETGSFRITRDRFGERFLDRQSPALKTIWANVRKSSKHGTILNRNKGNSGRRRTGRSEANIEAVRCSD